QGRVHALAFSSDGRLLLAADGAKTARETATLFEVASGLPVWSASEPRDAFLVASLGEEGDQVALAGPGKQVLVHDTRGRGLLHRLEGHTDWVTALAHSPDGVLLASADRAGGVRVWEADTGQEYLELEGHKAPVTALAWRKDGDVLATASDSGHLRLFG